MTQVSVIIRSMDRPTLVESLQSLDAQTYQNLEVVLVNAKGGTHSLFEQHTEKYKIRYVDDGGFGLSRSAAANVGLQEASGGMAMFLDDDDYLLPDHISNLVRVLEADTSLIAAYSAVQCVDKEKNPLPQTFGRYYAKARLMSGNFMPIHSVLFRLDRRTSACRFDPALDFYEDWDFWLELAEKGDFEYFPSPTAVYRLTEGSGFGVNGSDSRYSNDALQRISKKWHSKWTSDDIFHLMEACRMGFDKAEILHHSEIAHNERNARLELEFTERVFLLEQKLKETLDQLKSERQCAAEFEETANAYKVALDEILRSKSWRITQPLRTLAHPLRRKTIDS